MSVQLISVDAMARLEPETLVEALSGEAGVILLRSGLFDSRQARYSLVTARPFLAVRSFSTRCELRWEQENRVVFGNPWQVLENLMSRYELLDEVDYPFPLGGCFGYWGYDLKNFVEPRLPRNAINDLELPDCSLGFYDSLVVFDHQLDKVWIVATGLEPDGSRSRGAAARQVEFWQGRLAVAGNQNESASGEYRPERELAIVRSNFTRDDYLQIVVQAKEYIRRGDIYQVNLAQRLMVDTALSGWDLFRRLYDVSPAPFSAYFAGEELDVVSSSPELFLCLSGQQVRTRPIKGTRPRSLDPVRDAQLSYELQTSPKEMAELVMITDLLRNDLGRICEYGSVQVPELIRLERYPQVQHLVSTVEGRLRNDMTHAGALARCFPGGSITGAPKIRAIEIIDELEPVTRGAYTGCHGYLGFNRESQLSISIRTAVVAPAVTTFHAGAGIVADSDPEMEYDETLAKARGFLDAVGLVGKQNITSAAESSFGGRVRVPGNGKVKRRSSV